MTQFDTELHQLAQQIADKRTLEARQKALQFDLRQLEDKVRDLRIVLQKEEQDVEDLERISLTAFVQWITGRHEEALDREKAEAKAAGLKYQAALLEKQDCEAALKQVAETLRDLDKHKQRYNQLLEQKKAAMLAGGHPQAAQILELESQIDRLQPDLKELREAVAAGREALNLADTILMELARAADAASFDAMGGGLLTDIYKYNRMDKAQQNIQQLQRALRRFNTDMRQARPLVTVDMPGQGSMLRFADFFYDGLVVDLMAYSQINKSRREVTRVADQVRTALQQLDQSRKQVERQQDRLRAQIKQLVEQAK